MRGVRAKVQESDGDLRALAAATRDVYERNAARFAAERSKSLQERAWLDRFLALLPDGGTILDLGCGSGEPIAEYFLRRGYPVTGADFSHAMLGLARQRRPNGNWHQTDMRELDLPERFDGIIAWDSFFHLRPDEQRATLPRIARHLAPGGALLLTVGPVAGEVVGKVGADRVYHASLSPEEYGDILDDLGVDVVDFDPEDPDCSGHTVLLARCRE